MEDNLKQDLYQIVGPKKINFGEFNYGDEQNILWVRVNTTRTRTDVSKRKIFKVNGVMSICSVPGALKHGWLEERFDLANQSNRGRFILGDSNEIKYTVNENEFVKYTLEFEYNLDISYNDTPLKIKNILITNMRVV